MEHDRDINYEQDHLEQLLLKVEWLPVQLGLFASFVQSLLVWPIWPHVAQVSLPLHAFLPWPNFWHLKQRSGLGMYGDTGTLKYPICRCLGMVEGASSRSQLYPARRAEYAVDSQLSSVSSRHFYHWFCLFTLYWTMFTVDTWPALQMLSSTLNSFIFTETVSSTS